MKQNPSNRQVKKKNNQTQIKQALNSRDCNVLKGKSNNIQYKESLRVIQSLSFQVFTDILNHYRVLLVLCNIVMHCQNSLMSCCDKSTFRNTMACIIPISLCTLKVWKYYTQQVKLHWSLAPQTRVFGGKCACNQRLRQHQNVKQNLKH